MRDKGQVFYQRFQIEPIKEIEFSNKTKFYIY